MRTHDLRRSFANGGLLDGDVLPMIGKLLGHTQITARYTNDPVKAAANRIAGRIAEVAR